MDMFVTFINEPFVSAELVKSLDADSGISQPDNILFGKILSNFLGTLQLQQQGPLEVEGNTFLLETPKSKIISRDHNNRGISQYLSSIMNKDNEDISSESNLKGFPVNQEKKILDYYPRDIHQVIFLFEEIYNYSLQSGESPVRIVEQPEQYIEELNNNKGNNSVLPLKNEFITNDFISRDLQLFELPSPEIKESLKFINFFNIDKNKVEFSDPAIRDNQILKTSLLSYVKELMNSLNTEEAEISQTQRQHLFLDEPHISDLEISSYIRSDDEEKGIIEKDVVSVFIREIKSFLKDENIRPLATEETLTATENVAQGEMSKDKEHEQMQMSNFNKTSETENTFSTVGNSNARDSKVFEIPNKTLALDEKQNNLYNVSKKGDASIEVSIEPDGIGEIDIELVLDKGVINAQISVSDTLGKEFFEKNLDNIMRALINEGLNIGNFSVLLQNNRGMATYDSKKEDIKDVQIIDVTGLISSHSEGLISIFI